MRVSTSSSSEDQWLVSLLSAWFQRYRGANSPTTLQFTKPKVDKPKSLLWRAKPHKPELLCEKKLRVGPFRQSLSRAILEDPPFGVLLSEKGRRSFVYACLEPRSNDKKRAEHQTINCHVELSRKRIAPHMRVQECMSHFAYDLRCLPLVRDWPACVHGQIAPDHPDQIWFPDVHTGPGRGTPLQLFHLSKAAAPSKPDCPGVSRSDHSASWKESYRVGSANFSQRKIGHAHDNSADA